ncbi:MAG: diaminopimelate decarboxylase [Betaproteobacteria bacterium]|nr:diaminopimelate decarboxylase [Betaproteobacteria bacterium]
MSFATSLLPFDADTLTLIADRWDTPCYVYDARTLTDNYLRFEQALTNQPHQLCYAVKANPSLAILQLFARLGAGFDVVSGGELQRVVAAGGDPNKVVFSGVGKQTDEIALALSLGIHCFNVESESELYRINRIAGEQGQHAPVSLRVNPDVDAKTHPYISTGLKSNKFGVAHDDALRLYQLAASLPHLVLRGIDCHIGSQLTEIAPFVDALDRVLSLVDALAEYGIVLQHIDLGGGLGIRYHDETPPHVEAYIAALRERLAGRGLTLLLEPGRALVGNAGVLLTRVEYLKPGAEKQFAVVDAAMNDLMRPALYGAYHDIVAVHPRDEAPQQWEIVGPVCETGDFLGHDRALALAEGDLLAIKSAGAYGMSMSSQYNTRPRAAEVLVLAGQPVLIRQRESIASLFENERLPD